MDYTDPHQIIDILGKAAVLNRLDSFRTGHLLTLPTYGQVIMTGDFHGWVENFHKLQWFADLGRCQDRYVILHELIHSNGSPCPDASRVKAQDASCLLLVKAAQWKIDYPDQVHFLLGNHDLAQITNREITKGGAASIANFNQWVVIRFGEKAGGEIIEAIREFLLTLSLAAKCPNRIWMSHSLPTPGAMDNFDFSIFDRQWQLGDMTPRGSVYETVWGRSHSSEQLEELADLLNVDFFIVGHQNQDQGYQTQGDRLIILASDHSRGCLLPIDLSRRYSFNELLARIRFFYDIPNVKIET
ncbi:MAG: metallophosphoesterase [Phycisphaerae bacterium]